MKWHKGDIVDLFNTGKYNALGFTANARRSRFGDLIMGAGAAKKVADAYPGVPRALGVAVGAMKVPDYLLAFAEVDDQWFFALQTKRHWKDEYGNVTYDMADLARRSLEALNQYADEHPDMNFVVNCPLIGLGGYGHKKKFIKELVEQAVPANNVTVCVL
jgi:hypothetical protein